MIVKLLLVLLIAIGALLRFINLSPYKFYPDAYQSLLVSENIEKYKSVVGFLGDEGMLFPDFIAWTRAGYPLFINMANLFLMDKTKSAVVVTFVAGLLGIVIAYLFIKSLFKNKLAGLIGALLVTLSFNHIVWGGFIFTETLGVLVILIFLWLVFKNIKTESGIADWKDFLIGGVFGYAFITRYEYLVWLIPVTILVFMLNPTPWKKMLNIMSTFLFFISFFVSQLFPLGQALNSQVVSQIERNLWQLGVFGVLLILIYLLWQNKTLLKEIRIFIGSNVNSWVISLVVTTSVILILAFGQNLVGMKNFFLSEPLLTVLSVMGILFLIKDKYFYLVFFVIFSFTLFSVVYYNINPLIQRYTTHLLSVLLIPSSYGLLKILKSLNQKSKTVFIFVLLLGLIGYQFLLSYRGIRFWDDGAWFRESYEEKAAKMVLQEIKNEKDEILLVSFPESYYYHTKINTHSLIDSAPFIFIDDSLNSRRLVIVEDMGMRDQFPVFAKFLDEKMQEFKMKEFYVGEVYHYTTRTEVEDKPLVVYGLTIEQLKESIKNKFGS